MKKFAKLLAGATAVAGIVAGGLYIYNTYILEKPEDDVEDIDDIEDIEESEATENTEREYVSINISAPAAEAVEVEITEETKAE